MEAATVECDYYVSTPLPKAGTYVTVDTGIAKGVVAAAGTVVDLMHGFVRTSPFHVRGNT